MRLERARAQAGVVFALLACVGVIAVVTLCAVLGAIDLTRAFA